MSQFIRDPELNRLVSELNEKTTSRETARVSEFHEEVEDRAAPSSELRKLLLEMIRKSASDLALVAGAPPIYRIDGELSPAKGDSLSEHAIRQMFAPHLTERLRGHFDTHGHADFSLTIDDRESPAQFRVNVHRQRGTIAASIRVLPAAIPTIASLSLPPAVGELVARPHGLVLVCGPTGAGKTTTLAALVGEINRTRAKHIITIEDPIEYHHPNLKSVVEQIEIGRDASSFSMALRAALRQDPDVILVGEMRDLDTISVALTAAETGHMILSSLHTGSTTLAIDRMIDVFPSEQQGQVRQQLALSLHGIVSQQLLPRKSGSGRVAAAEVLIANDAVRHHIRKQKLQNLHSEITLGKRIGMVTMEESLASLVRSGLIDVDEARARANRLDELETMLRGV